jgi:hypothetical protein
VPRKKAKSKSVQQAVDSVGVAAASAVKAGNVTNAATDDLSVALIAMRDQLTSLTDWVDFFRNNGAVKPPIAPDDDGGGAAPPPPPPWPR